MEISFTTIDPTPFVIGGVILGLIVGAFSLAACIKEGVRRGQWFISILFIIFIAAVVSIFGVLAGYMVAIAHAGNQRTETFERLSSELGVEIVADRAVEDLLVSPDSVDMLSDPFTISYEIDGAVYQPTVVAKLVESSGQNHRFALYFQPGTNAELIELSADSLTEVGELDEAR